MAGDPQVEDALSRTRLANERTYLAWWRSGLTALAVSFGAGKLVPELSTGAAWPFELLGAAFGALGIAFIVFGVAGVGLGAATVLLVLVGSS